MKTSSLLLLVPLLAACHVQAKSGGDGDENVTIDANESGTVNFNLPFASGSINLPTAALKNGEFDLDGVKLMPGSTIKGFNVDAHGGAGSTVNIAFAAPKSPDEVRAYFLEQFKQKNVTASQSGNSISGTSRDGDTFVIDVRPAAQGSEGKIRIQDKS